MTTTEPGRRDQYVSFVVAGEEYAIDILRAREIVAYDTVTRVPMMPPAILGVVNLRGRIVPVVDLAHKLGLPPTQITRWTCILIVETSLDGELAPLGLLIDAVGDVIDLAAAEIEPAPAFGTRARLEHLRGIGHVGAKLVVLLDLDRLLAPEALLAGGSLDAARELAPALPRGGGERDADHERRAAAGVESKP